MSLQESLPEGFEDEKKEVYPEPSEEDLRRMDKMNAKRRQMWGNIIIYSLVSIALFGTIGYLLDKWLNTNPILLIVSIVLSFPFTQFILYKKVQKMIKH